MERTREIFPRGKVHGRLAAEGAVGGREERRGGLDDGHAAQRESRREARHVAHGSASQRDDAPVPPKPAPDELLEEAAEDVPRLGCFAVGDEERLGVQPFSASSEKRTAMQEKDFLRRDQEPAAGRKDAQARVQPGVGPLADENVGSRARRDEREGREPPSLLHAFGGFTSAM